MRTLSLLAAGLLLGFRADCVGRQTADTEARKQLEAQYAKLAQAFRQNDAHAFVALISRDAVMQGLDGHPVRGPEIEADLKEQFAHLQSVKAMRYTLDTVRLSGQQAVVRVTGKSSVMTMDPAGKAHTVDQWNTVENTWTRTPQGWRIARAKTIGLQVWVDGQPLRTGIAVWPQGPELERMIKTTLLGWNRAVQSGDFAAFHAGLAAPFRERFTPEKLRETFKEFAAKKIDIAPIEKLEPMLEPAGKIKEQSVLTVTGRYPTMPSQVHFSLKYVLEGDTWRLLSIDVHVQ